jgi:uncharacterized protein YkwD
MLILALLVATDWFNASEAERIFFHETNAARAEEGLDTLEYDSLLSKAARAHSEEMARLGYQSHISPVKKNRTVMMRIANAGFDTTGGYGAGENIVKLGRLRPQQGFSEVARFFFYQWAAEEGVKALMSSPGHRENILNRRFSRLGVGIALREEGDVLWIYVTQVFWGE